MTPLRLQKAGRSVRFAAILAAAAAIPVCAVQVRAQMPAPDGNGHARSTAPEVVETIHLRYLGPTNDLNDAQTALRNALPWLKVYGSASSETITLRGTQEEVETAKKLLAEFDHPKKVYRVTYTIAEMDNGKRISSRSVSVVVPANGKGTLKEGKRVPIVTGSTGTGSDITTQVQYIDLGMNLEANAMGSQLRTKIEESAVSEEKSVAGAQDPVIQQTMFEGTSPLSNAKPVVLGIVDVPGGSHQQQISVTAELLSGGHE